MLYGFVAFWNTSADAFCLPLEIISPILHDVVAITALPVNGDEVSYLHDVLSIDLGFQVNKKNNIYSTYINTFNRGSGPEGDVKHRAFLLFWICCILICTSSVAVVVEFAPFVLTILSQSYLNLGALLLSLLYKGMFTLLHWMRKEESVKTVFGPFWFL